MLDASTGFPAHLAIGRVVWRNQLIIRVHYQVIRRVLSSQLFICFVKIVTKTAFMFNETRPKSRPKKWGARELGWIISRYNMVEEEHALKRAPTYHHG